ncbi:beta-hydroxyacyl-ACP dehydratase [Candidatus Haliotispira prima]|uniref:Beta-hydroxyacyl-ACP dehydratase n=1 Tax=Candidatus Haliotispira prima TaxID=3034016 RepID=A0ABY8MH49_9SPIO|nr:beta-hydroxyacyl-ACP dehydratase [Candidatus Haliotispira prima]
MDANEIDRLLRKWRKKPLWSLVTEAVRWQEFRFGEDVLHKLLPHRSPFLLCGELRRFADVGLPDSPSGLLSGQNYIAADDPVFRGHFPDYPVYPGVLQLEMVGQLALCLGYFQEQLELLRGSHGSTGAPLIPAPEQDRTLNIRASRVLGAYYLRPVLPGRAVELQACQLGHSDGFFAKMFGQVIADGQVTMVCAQEVCFISED